MITLSRITRTIFLLVALSLKLFSITYDRATFSNGILKNDFFELNLGNDWIVSTNMLMYGTQSTVFMRNIDGLAVNAIYENPLELVGSLSDLRDKKRETLEFVGGYNSYSESNFLTNQGYNVLVLNYTQNAPPSPQHFHFFVDATSQNYLGSSDNWFSIELDFSSLNNEYVSGISYDEAKSIVQAINIENGSQPHLLNGLPYLTGQSNEAENGDSNSNAPESLDGSVILITSEDPVKETMVFENGTLTSIFDEINGQNIQRNEGLSYEYVTVNENQFSITMEGGEYYIFYENNGTGRLLDYSNNGELDESGTWNFTFEQYFWEDYDDFSGSNLDTNKWEVGFWGGGQTVSIVNDQAELSGTIFSSNNPIQMPNDISEIASDSTEGNTFLFFRDQNIYGIQADISLPSSNNEYEAGIYLASLDTNPLGSLGAELRYKTSGPVLLFDYFDSGSELEHQETGSMDTFHQLQITKIDGKTSHYLNGNLIKQFESSSHDEDYWSIGAFNDEGEAYTAFADNVRVLRRIGQEPTVTTILRDSNDLPVVIETNGNLQWNDTLDGVKLWGVWQDDDTNEWVIASANYINGRQKGAIGSYVSLPSQLDVDHPYSIDGDTILVSEDSGFQFYQLLKVEDDIIYAVDGDEYPLYEQSFWFTSKSLAEQFHGDRSGEDWQSYGDSSENSFSHGFAPDSLAGFSVIATEEDGSVDDPLYYGEDGINSSGDKTRTYQYEKISANIGKIIYRYEDEPNPMPEITTLTFLSPNNGNYTWAEYADDTFLTVIDQDSGTWEMTPGFERSTYDSSKWDEGYFSGGEPVQSVGSALILSGNATADIEYPVKMPAELVAAADGDNTGNSFLFVKPDEQITGLEANILLPSTNEKGAGVYIAIWDAYPFESHAIELALKDDGNATIVIDYLDEDGIEQEFVRDDNVSLDTNYSVRITHRLGKTSYFINNDEVVTSYNGATPDFWGFGAFGDENESYNAEISGIKILDKYPVEEYSNTLVETSDGNPVGLLSNDNDFSWGLDLNGTTLWSVSPDLSYQRFKYEFKGDYVTRTTINQWDDNEIEEVLKLPYSISEDGVLFIEDAPHGDEYLNLIGIDENGRISAKYGSNKEESEYKKFTQFSYPIATSDDKAMTLQISDNGETADTFAIVDENNNTQMIFDSITDVIDYLKVQKDDAFFQKWIQLTNDPVIDALEYYAVENNTTDFFYMDEDHSIESYQSIAFEEVTQGPLSFKKFKGTIVDGITHYSRNGVSNYSITPSSDNDPSSFSLATEFKNILWEKDLKELATSYAYQLDAEGFSVEINQGQKNDHGLDYIAINGSYLNNYNEKINSYYILVDLDHNYPDDDHYWLYARLNGSQEPASSSTYEDALDIAMSLNFNDSWQQSKVSLDDFTQSSDSTSTTDDQEAEYDSGVSVPFAVTSYSETSGWYNSEWFGDFFQSSNGWIFHLDFGWLYPGASSESDSCWMYGENYGWIWIDSYYFPLFHSDVKQGWIYFFKDTDPSGSVKNHFYDYSNEEWFGEKNLFEKDEIEEKNTQNQLDWLSSEIQKYW